MDSNRPLADDGSLMNTQQPHSAQPGILHLTLPDKQALYSAYMPFIKGGGLFIPTDKNYRLGDEIFVLLTLTEHNERLPIPGRVIWVTPPGAQSKRRQGVGIQLIGRDAESMQKKLETYLAGTLDSERPTFTL